MYIRIKRNKTTWFLEVTETEKVSNVKKQMSELLSGKSHSDLQFQISGKQTGTFVPLEDDNKLDQLGIVEDSILYLCLWIPNTSKIFYNFIYIFVLANPSDGKWETVDVPEFAPLIEDVKGKEVLK